MSEKPFRAPHHTISDAGLIGGGSLPRPGEISLAHNGVLFLDEFPEFKRNILDSLRQPLESGNVVISRVSQAVTFPASFMLIAAMNPCPCGYYGDPRRACICSGSQIHRYRTKVSGPLLDRIDIQIAVPALTIRELSLDAEEESSEAIRARVMAARDRAEGEVQGQAGPRKRADDGADGEEALRRKCRGEGPAGTGRREVRALRAGLPQDTQGVEDDSRS